MKMRHPLQQAVWHDFNSEREFRRVVIMYLKRRDPLGSMKDLLAGYINANVGEEESPRVELQM